MTELYRISGQLVRQAGVGLQLQHLNPKLNLAKSPGMGSQFLINCHWHWLKGCQDGVAVPLVSSPTCESRILPKVLLPPC